MLRVFNISSSGSQCHLSEPWDPWTSNHPQPRLLMWPEGFLHLLNITSYRGPLDISNSLFLTNLLSTQNSLNYFASVIWFYLYVLFSRSWALSEFFPHLLLTQHTTHQKFLRSSILTPDLSSSIYYKHHLPNYCSDFFQLYYCHFVLHCTFYTDLISFLRLLMTFHHL